MSAIKSGHPEYLSASVISQPQLLFLVQFTHHHLSDEGDVMNWAASSSLVSTVTAIDWILRLSWIT